MSNNTQLKLCVPMPDNYVCALDIGTRNVVAILASVEDDKIKVLDYDIMPHPQRFMYDGQIHEIDGVAKVVSKVIANLEAKTGFQLNEVSIAAAGRALITKKIEIEREIDVTAEIDQAILDVIEIEAVQQAQNEIESEINLDNKYKSRYFCVGYSVVRYYLDNVEIKNPKEHRAGSIKVEMLTTFLPQSVIDSLYTVVEKMGLFVKNMTLEPIAAIEVAIPDKFRLLNLALVDIGAGTSDIALTKDGVVFSYSMVDVAGDEVTEAIVREYLMDFDEAERFKISLADGEIQTHKYSDILGFEYSVKKEDAITKLAPVIDSIAKRIADAIIISNNGSPSAVFLIGGGSQFPNLKEKLASYLELQNERVAIKGVELVADILYECEKIKGPEFTTPLGIAAHSLHSHFNDFVHIKVNDNSIRMFNSKKICVSDAIVIVGFQARALLPQRGKSLSFIVNGEVRKISGEHGEVAQIYVNGSVAKLDTTLKNKDVVYIQPASAGIDAKARLSDIVDIKKEVVYNGVSYPLISNVLVNSEKKSESYLIKDDDIVEYSEIVTFEDFFNANLKVENHSTDYMDVSDYSVNSKPVNLEYVLKHGDVIANKNENKIDEKHENSITSPATSHGEKYRFDITVNNKSITINSKSNNLVFIDLFNYIEFDLKEPKGTLKLTLNGERARYTDVLKSGDIVEIGWM